MIRERWTPSPLIAGSAAVHLAAVASIFMQPHWWPAVLVMLIANHALLTAAGLWPRSDWLGPNWTRLPAAAAARGCIALTLDDGPEPRVTPQVLDMLDDYQAKATFFCIGARVARYPELAREIVRRGHALENHSHYHRHYFSLLGPWRLRREVELAQQTISKTIGQRALFFRAPAGLRNPFLEPVLSRMGLRLASWTRRGFDTVNGDADAVLTRLSRNLRAGNILLLHDGQAALTRSGSPVVLEVLPRLLAAVRAAGLTTITLRAALTSDGSPETTWAPCAVIPVFNHEGAIARVATAVADARLPCFLVDDGSSAPCARELDRLAATLPQVRVVRLAKNLGKGGAVCAGLRAAFAAGYTHALQIDADGQHALNDIARFIEAARAHPQALICGRPLFDASMPAIRRGGRYLTHVIVWLDTLSFEIRDSMCGFRVYPLKPLLALLDSARLGSRMDFDVEVLVRLHWRGQPMHWLDTRVCYPLDGVSHFQMVRDNLRMVALHLRLVVGMLLRSPLLIWRKFR